MKDPQEKIVPVWAPDGSQCPFPGYDVSAPSGTLQDIINSTLKWQKLSLALKSGQLGAVRTHTDFPVTHVCALFAAEAASTSPIWESFAFQEQVAELGVGSALSADSKGLFP